MDAFKVFVWFVAFLVGVAVAETLFALITSPFLVLLGIYPPTLIIYSALSAILLLLGAPETSSDLELFIILLFFSFSLSEVNRILAKNETVYTVYTIVTLYVGAFIATFFTADDEFIEQIKKKWKKL